MTYIPNTDRDRARMLEVLGLAEVDDLFQDVPQDLRYPWLELPSPISELEVLDELRTLSEYNVNLQDSPCFLGAGAYRHFVPSVVGHIVGRSEFYTAYTPYQPEISQGTLQSIFEYQSMICALTGMDVANASHYDGATALAEAIITALGVARGKRRKIVMSPAVHPEYREVVRTYTQGIDLTIEGEDEDAADSTSLIAHLDSEVAALVIENPSFFGELEHPSVLKSLADRTHEVGAILIVVADPIAQGMFAAPGSYGADIVCGEGQALGGGMNLGGPYLGYFATRDKYVHKMAGRIVGQTVDQEGRRGFVLTLSAREQHIRRERASSNICSNEALMALGAAVYLASLGKTGLRKVAELCYQKAHYAAERLCALPGYELATDKQFFKEFPLLCPKPVQEINDYLLEDWGIIGGYDLGQDYADMDDVMLVCVTEMNSREEIDLLAQALERVEVAR